MNFTKFNSNTLREMLNLSERKETLIAELKKIEEELLSHLGLFSKANTQPAQINSKQASKKTSLKASKSSLKPSKKNGLKSSKGQKKPSMRKTILAALAEAGSPGITVLDLAKKIKAKNSTVHTWFSSNLKKFSE